MTAKVPIKEIGMVKRGIKVILIDPRKTYVTIPTNAIASNIVILWPIVPHGDFFNNWLSIIIFLNFSIFICYKNYFDHKEV